MHDEREKARDETEASGQQQPVGQDSSKSQAGEMDESPQAGSGSEPPRSMGTRGTEFGQFGEADQAGQQGQSGTGQADLGSQAGTILAGRSDQQDLDQDQPGTTGRAQGEGFIGSQGTGSDDYLQQAGEEGGSAGGASASASTDTTGGSDFAEQGQGATEDDSDIETGQPSRSQDDDSDIEGGSRAA